MASKTLTLVRHAKSSWSRTDIDDRNRPLNSRGQRDAPEMARRYLDARGRPDLVLSSSARRTRETAHHFQQIMSLRPEQLTQRDELYLASTGTLLEVVSETWRHNLDHLMIIGHNPGMESLARAIDHRSPAHMPTACICNFKLEIDDEAMIESGTLDYVLHPKLEKAGILG